MTASDPRYLDPTEIVLELHAVVESRNGIFCHPPVAEAARRFIAVWAKHYQAYEDADRVTIVGCPTCGARANHWCVTATGRVYNMDFGPAYFHVARRRAVAAVEVSR